MGIHAVWLATGGKMDIELSKQDAIEFQEYLDKRFGPLGKDFGMDHPVDLDLVEDTVVLPEGGWTFLVASWRVEHGKMIQTWEKKRGK